MIQMKNFYPLETRILCVGGVIFQVSFTTDAVKSTTPLLLHSEDVKNLLCYALLHGPSSGNLCYAYDLPDGNQLRLDMAFKSWSLGSKYLFIRDGVVLRNSPLKVSANISVLPN